VEAATLKGHAMNKKLALLLGMTGSGICFAAPAPDPVTGRIAFVETDRAGKPVRKLTVELTSATGQACLGGNWKVARVLKDDSHVLKKPVYRIDKGRLELLFNGEICDAYDSYDGQLADQKFSGKHLQFGMNFSEPVGTVVGSYSGKPPVP
jgi:hypothetical protein